MLRGDEEHGVGIAFAGDEGGLATELDLVVELGFHFLLPVKDPPGVAASEAHLAGEKGTPFVRRGVVFKEQDLLPLFAHLLDMGGDVLIGHPFREELLTLLALGCSHFGGVGESHLVLGGDRRNAGEEDDKAQPEKIACFHAAAEYHETREKVKSRV